MQSLLALWWAAHTQSKARAVPARKTRDGDSVGHSLWTTWGRFHAHRGSLGRIRSSTRGVSQTFVGQHLCRAQPGLATVLVVARLSW